MLRHRQGSAVYPTGVSPIPLNLPLEHQLSLRHRKTVVLQPLLRQRTGEYRIDQRRLGPCPYQLTAGPLPQNSADGVNDDGFAGARLTCKHVKSTVKTDVRRLNNRNIFDMKQ